MRDLNRRLESLGHSGLLDQLEAPKGVSRYAMSETAKMAMAELMRALGPFGQVLSAVMKMQSKAKPVARQLEGAMRFLEAFGYDVTPPGGRPPQGPGEPPPPPTPQPGRPEEPDRALGRGVFEPMSEEEESVFGKEILTPRSSNVYSFSFYQEARRVGILYVTFLAWAPGMRKSDRAGRGPMYAYFDVPVSKYLQFKRDAQSSSAGEAIWDYLRTRGSQFAHQHQYRLMQGAIVPGLVPGGVYVPRKVTRRGFRQRALVNIGAGRRGFMRSTLPERLFDVNRGEPNRGAPNRGEPNRGQ